MMRLVMRCTVSTDIRQWTAMREGFMPPASRVANRVSWRQSIWVPQSGVPVRLSKHLPQDRQWTRPSLAQVSVLTPQRATPQAGQAGPAGCKRRNHQARQAVASSKESEKQQIKQTSDISSKISFFRTKADFQMDLIIGGAITRINLSLRKDPPFIRMVCRGLVHRLFAPWALW
jgi:hypothetical protein